MTNRFIPPPPSAGAIEAALKASNYAVDHIKAANAIDQPRVCRAEVELVRKQFEAEADFQGAWCWDEFLEARYGPASDGPAPEPVQTPPGIVDVVALHQATTAPRWYDNPQTLAFLRDVARDVASNFYRFNDVTRDRARAFLAATRAVK